MIVDPTRVCELIVGLGDVTVLGAEDVAGGPVRVHVETRSERPSCPGCCGPVWVKDQRWVELVDPAFGRPARLVWHKYRWSCPTPSCSVGSFTETAPHIAAARLVMTDRAGRWVTEQVGRFHRSVNEAEGERDPQGGIGFLRGGARPPVQEVIAFIDANRHRRTAEGLVWGVEPICAVCGIAPQTYHAAKRRPPSARAVRDAKLRVEIQRVNDANLQVYGADKIWDHLNNEDNIGVARCTIERLMREMGLEGCRRGRTWVRTTEGDQTLDQPVDLVDRQFQAPAPNRLWVADITYVKTHSRWVYVAFIIDVFSRMVVGWQASRSLRSDLAIDALEMAIWNRQRGGADLSGLIHHSDRGVQGELNWSSQHLSMMEVSDGATTAVGGQGASPGDAVAGTADPGASCGARVLASHRSRLEHRGRRCWCRGVGPCRVALVSPRWRDAAVASRRAGRSVLVVR